MTAARAGYTCMVVSLAVSAVLGTCYSVTICGMNKWVE